MVEYNYGKNVKALIDTHSNSCPGNACDWGDNYLGGGAGHPTKDCFPQQLQKLIMEEILNC